MNYVAESLSVTFNEVVDYSDGGRLFCVHGMLSTRCESETFADPVDSGVLTKQRRFTLSKVRPSLRFVEVMWQEPCGSW